jgi:hypothetical protein
MERRVSYLMAILLPIFNNSAEMLVGIGMGASAISMIRESLGCQDQAPSTNIQVGRV